MDNKSGLLPYGYSVFIWALFSCYLGCGSERDLISDPANSPILVPIDFQYKADQSAVVLEWEYFGLAPVARYRFVRFERDGAHLLNWVTLPAPSRIANERADIWEMAPLIDEEIHAGEKYDYTLWTETEKQRRVEASLGTIQVPGARIENVQFDPKEQAVTVSWHLAGGAPRYELIRQTDGISQIVFQSDNEADALFVDRVPIGNQQYTYTLRNYLAEGVILESRRFWFYPYRQTNLNTSLGSSNATRIVLPSSSLGNPISSLNVGAEGIFLQRLRKNGEIISSIPIRLAQQNLMDLTTFSTAITPPSNPAIPHIIIAGILPATNRMHLSVFSIQNGIAIEIPVDFTEWPVEDAQAFTTSAVAPDGTIYIGSERTLKTFRLSDEMFVASDVFGLGIPERIRSLVVVSSGLWMVTDLGRLLHSPPLVLGQQPAWQEVGLLSGVEPVAISANLDAVFVLDGAHGRILSFVFQGELGLEWSTLGHRDWSGVTASSFGDVYVWDTQDRLVLFENPPTLLERFAGEEDGEGGGL